MRFLLYKQALLGWLAGGSGKALKQCRENLARSIKKILEADLLILCSASILSDKKIGF
jgi:hypothetical protein